MCYGRAYWSRKSSFFPISIARLWFSGVSLLPLVYSIRPRQNNYLFDGFAARIFKDLRLLYKNIPHHDLSSFKNKNKKKFHPHGPPRFRIKFNVNVKISHPHVTKQHQNIKMKIKENNNPRVPDSIRYFSMLRIP